MIALGIAIMVFSFCLGTWMLLRQTDENRKAYKAFYHRTPEQLKQEADSLNKGIGTSTE
jgi:hypothetical protein